jgi:hypothetical protein
MNILPEDNNSSSYDELLQWQKDALDIELKRVEQCPQEFLDWVDVKMRFLIELK